MLQPTAPLGRRNRPNASFGVVAWLTALGVVAGLALAGQDHATPAGVAPTTARVGRPDASSSSAPPLGAMAEAARHATPIRVAAGPMGLTVGLGSAWVVTASDLRLWRLDPDTKAVTGGVALAASIPGPIDASHADNARSPAGHDLLPLAAVAAGSVWVLGAPGNDVLVQVLPDLYWLTRTIRLPAPGTGIVSGPGGMWVTTDAGLLIGIDPIEGRVGRTLRLGAGRVWAAAGSDATWVSAPDGRILRLNAAGATTATASGGGGPIAVKDGSVWVRTDRTLVRLDERSGKSMQRTDIGTSGDVAIAWALPSIVGLEISDRDSLVAPRESWIADTPAGLWITRPDLGEVWVIPAPVR